MTTLNICFNLVEEVEHNNRANPAVAFCSRACPAEQTALGIESPTVILKRLSTNEGQRRKKFENPLLPPNQSVFYCAVLLAFDHANNEMRCSSSNLKRKNTRSI